MHPLAKYLVTSILKHYLRFFFLKYLVSCNKILFFVNNSIFVIRYLIFPITVSCNKILLRVSCPSPMLFKGDDLFVFNFWICKSISLTVTGLNSNWLSSQRSFNHLDAGMIFIVLESFSTGSFIPVVCDRSDCCIFPSSIRVTEELVCISFD